MCFAGGSGSNGDAAVFRTVDGGVNWQPEDLPALPSAFIAGIDCPSVSDCYAAGYEEDSPAAIVVATDDRGGSWSRLALPAGTSFLDAIACPSTNTCLATGEEGTVGNKATMIVTTDAGRSWRNRTVPAGIAPDSIACPTVHDCYAVGQNARSKAALIATTDGGERWERQNLPKTGASTQYRLSFSCHLLRVRGSNREPARSRRNCDDGWRGDLEAPEHSHRGAIPDEHLVYFCHHLLFGGFEPFGSVCHCSNNRWRYRLECRGRPSWEQWLCRRFVSSSHHLLRSRRRCALASRDCRWHGERDDLEGSELSHGHILNISGLACASTSTCFAVGDSSTVHGKTIGFVVETTNGGQSWNKDTIPSGSSDLAAIACPSTSTCYAVGYDNKLMGSVLVSINGGGTGDPRLFLRLRALSLVSHVPP